MFLAKMPVQTDRRRRITDWPLLVLRGLALALLVAAFARPYLRGSKSSGADPVGLTVLLLDRSASMSANGVRDAWADSARAVVAGLPNGRRIAVVAFDAAAMVLLEPTNDHAAARAAIASAPVAAAGTRFGAGLRAAVGLLAHEPVPGEVVIVSDLQRSGVASTSAPALPAGTTLRSVVVPPESRDNTAVLAIEVQQVPNPSGRRTAVVAARIDRHGGTAPRTSEATLMVDGRVMGVESIVLPAEGNVRVTFDTVTLTRGEARVVVGIPADGMAGDNERFVVVPPELATVVTIVTPADSRPEEWRYLEQALEIGRDPSFTVVRVNRLDRAAVERSAAIILLDAPPPSGDAGVALDSWLRGGGGLVAVAGDRLATRRGELSPFQASLEGNADRPRGAVLGRAETSHPALAAFRDARTDAFAAVRLRRHAVMTASGGGAVLLRFDDGAPALIAGAIDAGRTGIVAIPLDSRRGDFPLQPAFLPFVRGLTEWASGAGSQLSTQESGEPWLAPPSIRTPVVRAPSGDLARPLAEARFIVPREAGFHEVFDGRAAGLPAGVIAVNAPATESDLAAIDGDDLLLGIAEMPSATLMSLPEQATASEARQRGWRWILLGFMAILGLEMVVASRGWRGVATRSPAVTDNGGPSR
jgi:hypothetical protein